MTGQPKPVSALSTDRASWTTESTRLQVWRSDVSTWQRQYLARLPPKTDTPPGPTSSPAAIRTMPRISWPWTSCTMPTTTRMAAIIHKTVAFMVRFIPSDGPLYPLLPRAGTRAAGRRTQADQACYRVCRSPVWPCRRMTSSAASSAQPASGMSDCCPAAHGGWLERESGAQSLEAAVQRFTATFDQPRP
jgi:hypothetical protein